MKSNTKKKYYSVGIEEMNGEFRIVSADKLASVNQHRQVLKRVNKRELAREMNRGRLIIS